MVHECYKCQQKFSQKSHLDAHLKKKFDCGKCNINFKTQYAYINGEYIHISKYTKNKKYKLRCQRGHELVAVKGKKNKQHFRHKNSSDVGGSPMTNWHCEWQGHFPITEVEFKKKEGQIKLRRADILINDFILEIQHSKIDDANVICRDHDYKLHGKKLIWIIDGNTDDVIEDQLQDGSFLIILNENWKYKSFSHTYDFYFVGYWK